MKLKRLLTITAFTVATIALPAHAADLMQAYFQALKSDPTYKKANADWESAKQNLPIARAAYLTQVAVTGNADRQYNNTTPNLSIPPTNGYNYDYGFVATVTQPIFNLAAWDAIKSASASVKSATATYAAASQDLMLRTVQAYVAVLQAYDQLRFQLASKRAVYEQLKVARQQFKVGLIAITGVYDARSAYDQAVAQSIADQNILNDKVEALAEITGIHYLRLVGIGKQVPLLPPQPNDITRWSAVAEHQNYGLIAQSYAVIAARETIKQQSVSWLPQLNATAQYSNDNQTTLHVGSFPAIPSIHAHNAAYGLSLNFPLVQGGAVIANTRQAQFNFLSASSQREYTYRSVISQTRQSFLGVITGISKIKADWQSVISAQNALNATKAGYEVGTRTMVDVLDDVKSLYQTQQQYADDQYTYIIDTIELKYNAGTLSVADLQAINRWLNSRIKLNLPQAALKSLQTYLPPIKPAPPVPFGKKHHPSNKRMAHLKKHKRAATKKHAMKHVAKKKVAKQLVKAKTHHVRRRHHRRAQHHVVHHAAVKTAAITAAVESKEPAKTAKHASHSIKKTHKHSRRHHHAAKRHVKKVKFDLSMPKHASKHVKPAVAAVPVKSAHKKAVSADEQVIPLYETPNVGSDLSSSRT